MPSGQEREWAYSTPPAPHGGTSVANIHIHIFKPTYSNHTYIPLHFIIVFIRAIHMYMFSCSLTTVY